MFTSSEVATANGILQYREERFTGFRCRISPERLNRHIDQTSTTSVNTDGCPFCRDRIFSVTPTFSDGTRILRGESVTFPNLFPFAQWHTVTVISSDHCIDLFSKKQIIDALTAQIEALQRFDGYPSINWNFLPSAGASLVHPHMQGIADQRPSVMVDRYLSASNQYSKKRGCRYWDAVKEQERSSDRYLFGNEIQWSAHAVPLGEREIRGIMPVSSLDDLEPYCELLAEGILKIIALYKKLGTDAFNMAIVFDKKNSDNGFSSFCSMISRINPNPASTSDSAFMERLHLEPVILTLPEELGRYYRNE